MCPALNTTEEELLRECRNDFINIATAQSRIAFLFMSIHAVNPAILGSITTYNPKPLLYGNMIYGTAVNIFGRPSMSIIGVVHRITFSILGSLMFNQSCMDFWNWLKETLSDRPFLLTCLGFLCGRIMLIHFLAYLYHVDTRTFGIGRSIDRDSGYEAMYL